jgi:HD-GYP domain-containing protein (c-di-GMP phosphodiesterase class II)
MLLRNQCLRLFLTVFLAQSGILALGFLVHYCLELSAIQNAAIEEASANPSGEVNEAVDTATCREAPAAELSSLLLESSVIAWGWISALLGIASYMLIARLHDRMIIRQAAAEADSLRYVQSLVRTRDAVIFGLAHMAECRDPMIGRHLERVSHYASRLASAARKHDRFRNHLTSEFIQHIGVASLLHDIGKVAIEDSILFKAGPLTQAERTRVQDHSAIGGKFLLDMERRLGGSPMLQMAREIVESHHERWDGRGYPAGLSGETIPLAARIVAIADVYEALASPRDYKPPIAHKTAMGIICREAGTQFDPDLVEILKEIEDDFHKIGWDYLNGNWPVARFCPEVFNSPEEDLLAGLSAVKEAINLEWEKSSSPLIL